MEIIHAFIVCKLSDVFEIQGLRYILMFNSVWSEWKVLLVLIAYTVSIELSLDCRLMLNRSKTVHDPVICV